MTVDGNKVTANATDGQVVMVLSHTYRLGNQSVTVMTQPLTFLKSGAEPSETQPAETDAPIEPSVTEPETSAPADTPDTDTVASVGGADTSDVTAKLDPEPAIDKGCASAAGGAGVAILSVVILLGGGWKIRKKD